VVPRRAVELLDRATAPLSHRLHSSACASATAALRSVELGTDTVGDAPNDDPRPMPEMDVHQTWAAVISLDFSTPDLASGSEASATMILDSNGPLPCHVPTRSRPHHAPPCPTIPLAEMVPSFIKASWDLPHE
jgi:hypothetical protein